MACNNQTISGIAVPCQGSTGGIQVAYITNYADDVFTYDDATKEVTGIKSGVTFSAFNFRRGSSSMSMARTIDNANGVNFVTTTVSLAFARQDTTKRIEMNALALSDLTAIVKDNNGMYYCLGMSQPVTVSNETSETGTAASDGNRYVLELQDVHTEIPPFLSSGATAQIVTNES